VVDLTDDIGVNAKYLVSPRNHGKVFNPNLSSILMYFWTISYPYLHCFLLIRWICQRILLLIL